MFLPGAFAIAAAYAALRWLFTRQPAAKTFGWISLFSIAMVVLMAAITEPGPLTDNPNADMLAMIFGGVACAEFFGWIFNSGTTAREERI